MMHRRQLLAQRGEAINVIAVADYANLVANGVLTNEQTVAEEPELVEGFVRAFLRGLQDTLHDLQMWAVRGLVPDLTVIVDITAAEGRRRRGGTHDRLESEADAFHEAIRHHFLTMAAEHPDRYLVLDGTQPPERLHEQVLTRLEVMGLVAADPGAAP